MTVAHSFTRVSDLTPSGLGHVLRLAEELKQDEI